MMKKILITLLLTIFSFSLFAQDYELSDYEIYRMKMDAELYATPAVQDTVYDTVYVEVEASEPVIVNNYYDGYNQPNLRFNLAFGYGWGYYNQPYYGYYNSWYGYGWGYPYYGYGYYPYYGYNHYYGHNYYNYGYYSQPRGQRYATSNALGWNRNYYKPYNKTYSSGNVNRATPARTSSVAKSAQVRRPTQSQATTRYTRNGTTDKTKSRTIGERNYRPTFKSPRTNSGAEYNRSSTNTRKTTTVQRSSQQRSTYVRPSNSQSRSSASYNRPSSSTSRSYRAPSTAPSRSSSSYRSSSPSRSSGSYSRSSGGSSSRGSTGGARSGSKR